MDGNYWNRTIHFFLIQSSDAELKKCIYDYLSKLKLPIFTLQEFSPFLYNLHDIFFMLPPQKKEVRKRQWSFTDPVLWDCLIWLVTVWDFFRVCYLFVFAGEDLRGELRFGTPWITSLTQPLFFCLSQSRSDWT